MNISKTALMMFQPRIKTETLELESRYGNDGFMMHFGYVDDNDIDVLQDNVRDFLLNTVPVSVRIRFVVTPDGLGFSQVSVIVADDN